MEPLPIPTPSPSVEVGGIKHRHPQATLEQGGSKDLPQRCAICKWYTEVYHGILRCTEIYCGILRYTVICVYWDG